MNVFINCPYDQKYISLLRYIIFTLIYLDCDPLLVMSDSDCRKTRIEKIESMINQADISIHDLSRIKSNKKKEYARLNMPFELGIDYGLTLNSRKNKKYLILENEDYSYQKGFSDYAGFDIFAHHNDAATLVKIIRDWFVNNNISPNAIGAYKIFLDYFDCWSFMYDSLMIKGYSKKQLNSIPVNEFIGHVKEWIKKIRAS